MTDPKYGKTDPNNDPHVGGNQVTLNIDLHSNNKLLEITHNLNPFISIKKLHLKLAVSTPLLPSGLEAQEAGTQLAWEAREGPTGWMLVTRSTRWGAMAARDHDLFLQVPDYEKEQVPEQVTKAAREMNRKAFAEKLREINMSE